MLKGSPKEDYLGITPVLVKEAYSKERVVRTAASFAGLDGSWLDPAGHVYVSMLKYLFDTFVPFVFRQ